LRGVSRQAIWNLVRRGRLKTLVVGGHTLVNLDDVEKFQPKMRGRPKKMKGKNDDS
jgi:hypothetical protein